MDESGNGMQATANSYTSDGYLIQSDETSSDGYFTIELPLDTTLSLHFLKDGYVKVTKTVLLESADEQLEFGEIVLVEALTLYASSLSTVANPGEKLLLPFAVSNTGENMETVDFSVSNAGGWATRVVDQNGREIKSAVMASTPTLKLEVTIPAASSGANTIKLTATGKTIVTLNFLLNIEPANESILFCRFPGKWAILGDPVVFQVELRNHFSFETRFMLSVDSLPSGWVASIKTADGEHVTEIILGAEESVNLAVEVESPSSATADGNYDFSVKVESVDHNVTASLPFSIALSEPEAAEEIAITRKFPEVKVEAGEVVHYHITVSNLGDMNRLLFH